MSIIERSSPLNLAYKVIVVTNASSEVGVAVSNTLLKANALVLGTDSQPKDDSLSASTYSHFQFHQCKLTDQSAANDIIAEAKHKFKTDHIDGLVNLMTVVDDPETQTAHQTLATACAEAIQPALEGGAIVNTFIEAASDGSSDASVADKMMKVTKACSKDSTDKVRCISITPAQEGKEKAHQQYEGVKEHFKFLFNRLGNQHSSKQVSEVTSGRQAIFDFSNTILFSISGSSEGMDGATIDTRGRLIEGY